MALIVTFAGVLGAAIGSFLNVVVHRVPRRESLVSPRSRCPSCWAEITARDNVPVLSWLWLRGHCRHCRATISPRYPAVELVTAVTFAAVVAARGVSVELVVMLPFAAALIALAGIDIDHQIVPNRLLAPVAAWGLAASAVVRPEQLLELAVAGAAAFGLLLVAAIAYPAGMGMGDVKLAGVMGLYLGTSIAPALFAAFLAGSLAGMVALLRHGSAARKQGVPFAPFLALGGLVGLLAGPELVQFYTRSFLGS
jgi:leader peptidase (prepilin peptidase) / N-methyltransferase